MLVDAKSVSQTGLDMHGRPWYQVIYPSYGDFKLPVYLWLASPAIKLFGETAWALRLPSAMVGVVTVGLVGALSYGLLLDGKKSAKTFAPMVALISMLTMAVSPWSVLFSRTAFEGHVGQMLVCLSMVCLVFSFRTRQKWLFWVSPIIGGLATYAYFSVRFVWPVIFLALTMWLITQSVKTSKLSRTRILSPLLKLTVPLILFTALLIPMINSPLYADSNRFRLGTDSVLKNEKQILESNVYREIAGNTVVDRIVFHRWLLTGRELLRNYGDNMSAQFLFVSGDPNLRHGTGLHGVFFVTLLPFLMIGWYFLFDRYRGLCLVLFSWWILALLPASVPDNTPHALRSLNALVPLVVVISCGLSYAVQTVGRKVQGLSRGVVFSVAAFVIFILPSISFFYMYLSIYPQLSAQDWQQGFPELATAIVELREGTPVYLQPFDDKFYLWMMAFGPYSGTDFQSWRSQKYQYQSFDDISFTPFPGWNNVLNQSSRVVVAGHAADIEKLLVTEPVTMVKQTPILDPAGNTVYKAVLIDKKL